METIAQIIAFLGFVGLIVGLFNPKRALFYIKKPTLQTRKVALITYIGIILFAGFLGSNSEEYKQRMKAEEGTKQKKQQVTKTSQDVATPVSGKVNDKHPQNVLTKSPELTKLVQLLNDQGIDICSLQDSIVNYETDFERRFVILYQTQVKDSSELFKLDSAFQHYTVEKVSQVLNLPGNLIQASWLDEEVLKLCGQNNITRWKYLSSAEVKSKIAAFSQKMYKDSIRFYTAKAYDDVWHKEDLKLALKHYNKALTFADTSLVKNETITLYLDLGKFYKKQRNTIQTIHYLRKAYNLEGKGGNACQLLREETRQRVVTGYYTYSVCCDGTTSSSTGRGTCSHHGGVCSTKSEPIYQTRYTMQCN